MNGYALIDATLLYLLVLGDVLRRLGDPWSWRIARAWTALRHPIKWRRAKRRRARKEHIR